MCKEPSCRITPVSSPVHSVARRKLRKVAGIGGLRGRNSQQSAENIKTQGQWALAIRGVAADSASGQMRIANVAQHMGLNHSVRQGAVRLFALAVDANFHKGRRKDYVVASCLYLQSRLKREPHMLIDFSERLQVSLHVEKRTMGGADLQINVFELGGTYLKLRTTLHLPDPMPMTDPAIYSLRFANRLDLGQDKHKVATDASRLVRRFQADWMSEGRRPAGVCGACLLVASRMNGYHRTPEEIAQIVKISPATVKRRLLEFARTDMADKTVEQWKNMSDADLEAPGEALPPVVKDQMRQAAKRRKLDANGRSESADIREEDEDGDEGNGEGSQSDTEERRARNEAKTSQMGTAIQQASELLGEEEEGEEEDVDLAPPQPDQYVKDLDAAGDNPEDAQNERARAIRKFRRINKVASIGQADADVDLEELQEDVEEFDQEEDEAMVEQDEGEEGEKDDDAGDKEERAASSSLKPNVQDDEARYRNLKFDQWDDPVAVRKHVEEKYMPRIRLESALTEKHVDDRLELWLGVRDPREIMLEIEVVNRALRQREKQARAEPDGELDDVDDDEIEGIITMTEAEQRTRARMWLSHNGRWLEEDKGEPVPPSKMIVDRADGWQRSNSRRPSTSGTMPTRYPARSVISPPHAPPLTLLAEDEKEEQACQADTTVPNAAGSDGQLHDAKELFEPYQRRCVQGARPGSGRRVH